MSVKRFQIKEWYFFSGFSIVSILAFFLVKFVPSLDGPQHLYNARLIVELIQGNDIIAQFFRFNPIIVGNSSALFLMAFLMFVFPAWLAEKIFLSICIIALALSFRYLIRSFRKTNYLMYLLIFPFSFTSLFMMGYYNFSLAFIPFFLALGYLKRHEYSLGIRQIIWLALLGLSIYVTHAVVFILFGLIIFLHFIFDLGQILISKDSGENRWLSIIKYYLFILIALLPAAVLWIQYYIHLKSQYLIPTTMEYRSASDILGELFKLRILIGLHHGKEAGPNMIMLCCLIGLLLMAIIPLHRYFPSLTPPEVKKIKDPDWLKWSFITIVLLILTLFLPDQVVTGSMSVRLSILFFLGFIVLLNLHPFPKMIVLISLLVFWIAFTWHRFVIFDFHRSLNKEIADLEDAAEHIRPGTIVFPINCSDNWLQLHFHCYLGVEKTIVNIQNPQSKGQMPVSWNYNEMPNILLGELDQQQSGAFWVSGNKKLNPVSADYIFIWKSTLIETVEGVKALLDKIDPYYNQAFRSKNGNALLLQLNE